MNFEQITEKLNREFSGESRQLVFWYDDEGEFTEDIDSIQLKNAKVLHLKKDNQFRIKYFLEKEDTSTNYLIYAPFAKPDLRENHLADMLLYSKEFFADRASMIAMDLQINPLGKMVIQQHIKFFANKERTQKFYDLAKNGLDENAIEMAMMCVLCRVKVISFEEVLRCIITESEPTESEYLSEFEKYSLLPAFWKQAESEFGYTDTNPTLEKLILTLFVTYAGQSIHENLPKQWAPFFSVKVGNIMAFLDQLMNNVLYGACYDQISKAVYKKLGANEYFERMNPEALVDCSLFEGVDTILLRWITERLENEDLGVKLQGKSIPEICEERRKMHFGSRTEKAYFLLENAYGVISQGMYREIRGIQKLVDAYASSLYRVDQQYRYFYYYYDSIEDTRPYEKLREQVENIYTHEYLNKITVNWNQEMKKGGNETGLEKQRNFYAKWVGSTKEKTAVIISDAFRYEVAESLFEKMEDDEKCSAKLTALQGVLPSYTPLGMAALLPHHSLEYTENGDILVDHKPCATTEQRAEILREYKKDSACVQFDTLKNMKQAELRTIFTGKEVVYIYHNQIDARGDNVRTENEVFAACEDAVTEIHKMVRKISSQANCHHFLITADHGFLYKRNPIPSSDKIGGIVIPNGDLGKRYLISREPFDEYGVGHTTIGEVLGNADKRIINYPLSSDIFQSPGAGLNYVHGGCSPQEMLIPLIDVRVERNRMETRQAMIDWVTVNNKITNLIVNIDFIQKEPVSDVVKAAVYRIYFISESGEKISNEHICNADRKGGENGLFHFQFTLKNQKYDVGKTYYLIAYDMQSQMEVMRREVMIDIAFSGDFGFFD